MRKEVKEVIDLLNEHAKVVEFEPSQEVLRLYKYRIVPSNMGGLWDTAYSCMVLAEGDLRQLSAYMLFSQIRMCENDMFTLDHMKAMFLDSVPLSANFLSTCGFEELWDDTQKIMGILDLIETKEEYREMLDAYCYYVTNLHNWVHFYFPWYLGDNFRMTKTADVEVMAKMLKDAGM